jgi:hypothetical protein
MDDQQLTPARLADVATYLEDATKAFRTWGVKIASGTRLLKSIDLLRQIADSGQYPSDRVCLAVIGEAIRDAQEFIEIANVLPDNPIEAVQHDLGRAVRGDLIAPGPTGPNLQFQSQLWVAAMIGEPDFPAGVLSMRSSEESPDYVLRNGTLEYGVEVKRPSGKLDAKTIVRKAARQIRSPRFHGGVIVVDLTDCVPVEFRLQFGSGAQPNAAVPENIKTLLGGLHAEIFSELDTLLRDRREHVYSLIGFARSTYWDECDLAFPQLSRYVATVNYWRRDHRTLRAHRARWLGSLIHAGITRAGHLELAHRAINL